MAIEIQAYGSIRFQTRYLKDLSMLKYKTDTRTVVYSIGVVVYGLARHIGEWIYNNIKSTWTEEHDKR